MSDQVVTAIIAGLSILLLVEVLAFIVAYAIPNRWHRTTIGRTMMYLAGSFALILVYSFGASWLGIPQSTRREAGLWVYAFLVVAWGRLFLALRYVQKGHITAANPTYTPVTDWVRKTFKLKRRKNG